MNEVHEILFPGWTAELKTAPNAANWANPVASPGKKQVDSFASFFWVESWICVIS